MTRPAPLEPSKVGDAEARLTELLGPQLADVIATLSATDGDSPYLVELPEDWGIDHSAQEVASLVARTANAAARAARAAGIARAEHKRAKGVFDRKYKRSRTGGNEHEREAAAMEAAKVEHSAMVFADSLAELADAFETGARIRSESIRKIMDKLTDMQKHEARGTHGALQDGDFRTY